MGTPGVSMPTEAPTEPPTQPPTDEEAPNEEEPGVIPDWAIKALLAITSAVVIAVLVSVAFGSGDSDSGGSATNAPTSAPTTQLEGIWSALKSTIATLTGLAADSISAIAGRRSDSTVLQINAANPAEAYNVIQVLSSTSGTTITTMLVQQLNASNYTGPMPTMITTVIQQVTAAESGSSGSSDDMMILIAVMVATVVLLLAVLVVGALVYMWKRSQQPATQTQEQATPHEIAMGNVGVIMNPMHSPQVKGAQE